jgi:signal transduction histidine kinase
LLVAIRAKLDRRAQLDAAQTRQMSDLKRTILTTLNHEFRTPLTYITSYTEILRNSEADLSADEFKKILHGIEVGSERLKRLVEDFILLVELQSGEARKTFERRRMVDDNWPGLLTAALGKFTTPAAARRVALTPDIPAALPVLALDYEYFGKALQRLIENAIKFSKKSGGHVTLRARAEKDKVVIQIQDEGVGLRPEDLGQLFDVFHQIDRAKMEQQGSGSGLAIAREIVQMHGGTLTAASEFGVGSTFTIELPTATI